MQHKLKIYNSLNRQKEPFEPLNEGYVGLYVCGPTVYSDVHLGNCRTFVSFDVVYRYLMYLGYKVRYVRNITDVGHLEGDTDSDAEDKISKKARLEQLEPMELVQRHTRSFHHILGMLNTLTPSIEPRATGHIVEQIQMVQEILDNGYAYVKNGSVYFNTPKFIKDYGVYGKLSGKQVDDLLTETRDDLKNQDEKNHPSDFAIWIKADERHLMRWPSPWSTGFPGWHLECSAMSTKYLGKQFDIHGGGMDLQFPHHENEIAQNYGACGCMPVRFWMHGNMLLVNSRKMSKTPDPETGKSNSITPVELFSGENEIFSKPYSPMVVRFFMLQSHYRSTLDLTDDALLAAERGFRRLMEANKTLQGMAYTGKGAEGPLGKEVKKLIAQVHEEMNDDFNTPKALAVLFDLVTKVNSLKDGHLSIDEIPEETFQKLKSTFHDFIYDIFGLKDELDGGAEGNGLADGLMQLIIDIRQQARANKDWATSDKIRDALKELEIVLKDGKEGTSWVKG
ncbi:MAG: cysteine--tRNA ligase [Lewinellaceae bacterium]|nr:cysteine--tRNA ligase [Phaeodactylibacter sp.]MCB9037841.1 cysteine--tRNA ligase [Lewinellaceae bacterium]